MKLPVTSSSQNAPAARCPDGRMAAHGLMETPITFESGCAFRNSSPTVLTSSRLGEAGSASVLLGPSCSCSQPTVFTSQSHTLVTTLPDSRSYQAFPTIPLTAGIAPDMKMLCPTAVIVGTCA